MAEAALTKLFALCAAEVACATHYSQLPEALDRALARMHVDQRGPFMERVRTMMYSARGARRVPALIHSVARGDSIARALDTDGESGFAEGLYLSITCSESLARIDVNDAIEASAQTRFGAYRMRRQHDACAPWPAAAPDPLLFRAGQFDVPVLLLSGGLDPVTPPEWAAEVATQFADSRHVIVPTGGHLFDGMSGFESCIDAMVLRFLATRAPHDVDASCVDRMDAGPFLTQ